MQRRPRHNGRRYPWREWFSQKVFTLHKGRHYRCRTDTMAGMCRAAGYEGRGGCVPCNVKITISPDSQSLTVRIVSYREEPTDAPAPD